jgi:hypothetical protein
MIAPSRVNVMFYKISIILLWYTDFDFPRQEFEGIVLHINVKFSKELITGLLRRMSVMMSKGYTLRSTALLSALKLLT